MKISLFIIIIFLSFFSLYFQRSEPLIQKNDSTTLKLAFGSCNKFIWDDKSDIIYKIKDYHPDIFIWLGAQFEKICNSKHKIGDAAYVEDMSLWFMFFAFPGVEKARGRLFNSYYDPAYQSLKNETKIIGVWDNHDYGKDWGKLI